MNGQHLALSFVVLSLLPHGAIGCAGQASLHTESTRISARDAGPYRAIVIGIENYAAFPPVYAAKNDVDGLATLLRDEYGYDVQSLHDASEATIKQAFDNLAGPPDQGGVRETDHLLIYFSGHGQTDPNTVTRSSRASAGYWLPADATPVSQAVWQSDQSGSVVNAHWIPRDDYVVTQLKRLRASQILVIDDSCYSGAIERQDDVETRETGNSPFRAPVGVSGPSQSVPVGGERVKAGRYKRVRLWMTAGGNEVVEGAAEGQGSSPFTTHLIEVLRQNEGVLNGRKVFERISERMLTAGEQQTPDYVPLPRAEHEGGDFLFVKKTYSVDQRELPMGTVTAQVTEVRGKDQRDKAEQIASLAFSALDEIDQHSTAIRPNGKPRPLFLTVSLSDQGALTLNLIDRDDEQILATSKQILPDNAAELAASVRAAVFNLHKSGSDELHGKEISVDLVRRALIAQRVQTWDIYLLGAASAYVDFDKDGLLHAPAFGLRLGVEHNLLPWLLLGPVFGFDATKSQTSRPAFFGDLANGTYANNRSVGQARLQTLSGMLRVTARVPHGILLPFLYAALGAAWMKVDLTDEYFEAATASDLLPLNVVNRRKDTSSWAFVWELGAGAHLVLSSRLSLMAQINVFKAYHDMKVDSRIMGFNQIKDTRTDFQSIQTVSLQAGTAVLF